MPGYFNRGPESTTKRFTLISRYTRPTGATKESPNILPEDTRVSYETLTHHRKAEAGVKRARVALEALIGPFRLRKAVRAAMKTGMLMPFPVSVQRGKAVARLERGQNMREVCACVCVCVCVC